MLTLFPDAEIPEEQEEPSHEDEEFGNVSPVYDAEIKQEHTDADTDNDEINGKSSRWGDLGFRKVWGNILKFLEELERMFSNRFRGVQETWGALAETVPFFHVGAPTLPSLSPSNVEQSELSHLPDVQKTDLRNVTKG